MIVDEKEPLIHYASKYYDPVKAHEYYMRTRELKGRSPSQLSDEGKEIWNQTKSNITAEKNQKLEEEKEKSDNEIEDLRNEANEVKERITQKLYELNDLLTQWGAGEKETISKKRDDDINDVTENAQGNRDAIDARTERRIKAIRQQPIPIGLSKEQRRKFIAERNEKIAKITGDAEVEKEQITSDANKDKTNIRTKAREDSSEVSGAVNSAKSANRSDAQEQRKQVSMELKSAIKAAREAYKQAKANVNQSYEEIYNEEFGKILAEHAKPAKASKSSSKTTSSSGSSKERKVRQKSERKAYTPNVSRESVQKELAERRKSK